MCISSGQIWVQHVLGVGVENLGFVRFNPPGPQLVKCSTALTFLIFFGSIKTDYIEGLNNFQSSMETFIIIVALNDS